MEFLESVTKLAFTIRDLDCGGKLCIFKRCFFHFSLLLFLPVAVTISKNGNCGEVRKDLFFSVKFPFAKLHKPLHI